MALDNGSGNRLADSLERFQSIYDRHRYLDLYALTSEYWNSETDIRRLPVDALILGARLAGRLGGQRLARWLLRKAFEQEPSNPRVRYFTHNLNPLRVSIFDDIRDFLASPDIGGEDADLRASWYAEFAFRWAVLRDFDSAYDCLRMAHSLARDVGWVLYVESVVYALADLRTDALRTAERALEANPGAPYAVYGLGMALGNLGRVEEAAVRSFAEAEAGQSYEIVLAACWNLCALAETLEGDERRRALDRARGLAERLPDLMPLADRETRKMVACANLDIAELADDHAGMERWLSEVHSPFHQQVLANLARNSGGMRVRLPFRRTIQKYATCVPSSIAAAMSAGGMGISANEMAAELTFGGTYEWAAADWLRARGYHVRFFFATPEVSKRLIRNGIAFIVSWEHEESGHAVAVVGVDERAETFLAHDPGLFRSSEYLFTALDPCLSPVGIKGMAVVKQDQAAKLDSLLPPESVVMEAAEEQAKRSRLYGPSASRQVVVDLLERFPSHPGSRYLEAAQALEDGQVGQALGRLEELLREFPKSPIVRLGFMFACRALGNTALLRQALKDIVEAGRLPGVEARQDWIYPPDRYVYEYADLLRLSADTRGRAESLLLKLIKRQGTSAGAWHNLADLLWQKRDTQGALLAYRVSSCLAESDEHCAWTYAGALAAESREEEGLLWLETRVRRFQNTPHGVGTWISWISVLEDLGYPERALSACREALAQQGASAELLGFAVPFFARMGDWTRAEAELERLRDAGRPHAYFEASTRLCQMRGDLGGAARNAASWIAELPRSIEARRALLDIIDSREGPDVAVRASLKWMRENRNHEDFEEAYCAQLDRASAPRGKKYSVLLRRLKRNPDDAWAWSELTYTGLNEYALADDPKRKRLEPRIVRYLTECDRTSAGAASTLRLHALWSELRGDWGAAVARSLESIALDPETIFSYRRVWQCSSRLRAEEREDLWSRIEPMFVSSAGRLSIARDVAGLIAERFGVPAAEKGIEKWRAARPEDPDILEAAADLLIDYGHGRSDAARAISLLEPAVQRYPYHSGLRFSLAKAFHIAGRVSDAETVLTEIARRHPDSSSAKIQLAWISSRRGDVSGACEFLDKAVAAEPQNVDLPDARAQILIAHARYDEAIRGIEDGLRRLPSNVRWRERAVALLTQCGAADQAIRAARGGTEVDPRNANAWLVLGRTLNELRHYAEIGEIESDLRKSLELDGLLFEAADLLAMLLAEQRQYDKASKIMVDIEPRMGDPSPALGRVAWIHRQSGQKREAVDEMARVLEAYPWYGWGWSILMGWLEEDGAWDRARQLLEGIPAPMLTNTGFRLRRLWLLQKAKTDVERLDEEWDGLLRDFPEDVPLHVSRYDVLDEARRWKEAGAVIEAIAEVEPNDPVILARRCEALARENKKDAACETALRVCFLPVEEYTWPSERVWEVARDEGFAADLSLRLEQRLLAGERPTVQSVSGLAAYAMRNAKKRRGHLASRGWFPCRGARELTRLVREISGAAWDGSEHRAVIYALLCDYGYGRQVRKLSAATGSAAVTTVREWAQIGRSCLASGRFIEARRWLGTWRERAGVEMWMVANYVVSLPGSRRNRLEERYNSARDALAGLPHDHCAKYLAHVLAEACALLGRKEAFLETWESQAGYFDGTLGQGEFFKPKDRYLLAGIPEMAEDLERRGRWRARGVFWKLRLRRKVARSLPSAPKGLIRAISAPLIYIGFILAYLIMSFLMNRNVPQTGGPGGPGPTPPRLSLAAPPSPGPGRLRAPRPAQPSRSPGDLSPFALFSGDLAVKVTQSSSGGGSYGATGEVINRGTKTFHFVIVKFEFCDKSGRVVGTLMNAARRDEYVPPGAVKSFVVRGTGRLDYVKVRAFVVYAVESK